MVFQGKFVLTYAYMGELFGLHMDAIEAVAREGLACVVHMELEVLFDDIFLLLLANEVVRKAEVRCKANYIYWYTILHGTSAQ